MGDLALRDGMSEEELDLALRDGMSEEELERALALGFDAGDPPPPAPAPPAPRVSPSPLGHGVDPSSTMAQPPAYHTGGGDDPWAPTTTESSSLDYIAADISAASDPVPTVVGEGGQEGTDFPSEEEEDERVRRLRESAARLGAALASAASDLGDRAAHGISDGVARGRGGLGRLWSSLGEGTVRARNRAGEIARAAGGGAPPSVGPVASRLARRAREVTDSVREMAAPAVGPVLEKTGEAGRTVAARLGGATERLHLSEKLAEVGQSVRQLDERHGITAKTAEAVAGGMDLIASKIAKGKAEDTGADHQESATDVSPGLELEENNGNSFSTSYRTG